MQCWNKKYDTSENKGKLYLRLIQDKEDIVDLIICDYTGKRVKNGTLAVFVDHGAMMLMDGVTDKCKIKTDAYGHLLTLRELDHRLTCESHGVKGDLPDFLKEILKRASKVEVHKCDDHKHH